MKVQRPHLPPLNTAVHRLEDGMIILSGPASGERECEGRRLERLIASAERVFVFLLACLDVGFAGRRSIQRFFVEWRLKHDGRAYTYAGVALIFGVLLSRGQLRPVVPQPVHSWSLALFLLGMASASWVVLTWCASGAAIFRPVFPRTVTLPCSQAQQIEEGVEQAYKRNETLHQEKVKVLAELEQRRLISNRARKLGLPATVKLPEHPHQEGGRK